MEVWIEIEQLQSGFDFGVVTSLVEVWIEIVPFCEFPVILPVTSLVEVWIEILHCRCTHSTTRSLPLWKCGLK